MGLGLPELVIIVLILAVLAGAVSLGVWLLVRIAKKDEPNSASGGTHKKCPDCAEYVLIEARVCKHCGFRFEPQAA